MEAHGTGIEYAYDRAKQLLRLHSDRGEVLRQAIVACRKGGTLSIMGVYGLMDKCPLSVIMNKGLTVRTTQAARSEVPAASAGARGAGRAGSVVPRDAPVLARGRAARLRAVQAQGGRVRASGLQAVTTGGPPGTGVPPHERRCASRPLLASTDVSLARRVTATPARHAESRRQ